MSTKFTKNNVALNSTNVRVLTLKQRCAHYLMDGMYACVPGVTKQLVSRIFFSPSQYRATPSEKALLREGQESTIQVHDKTLHIWRWGNGPAILFVHGWNGSGVQFNRFFEPLIDAGYSVIAYDGPAHGISEGKTTNYFELSEAVKAVIASLSGEPIHAIVAHSLGASAAINCLAALQYPMKAVLIAPALRLQEMVFRTLEYYGVPNRICKQYIADAEKRLGYNFDNDDPYRLISRLSGPTLIIHDKADRVVSYSETRKNLNGSENMALYSTVGLGHKQILKNKSTISTVLEFLLRSDGYLPDGLDAKKRHIGNWI